MKFLIKQKKIFDDLTNLPRLTGTSIVVGGEGSSSNSISTSVLIESTCFSYVIFKPPPLISEVKIPWLLFPPVIMSENNNKKIQYF